MNKQIIANHLIAAFEGLPVREQMLRTLNPRSVEKRIVEKFGKEAYAELTKAASSDWRDAWLLFEKHNGIFTHGDYQKVMGE